VVFYPSGKKSNIKSIETFNAPSRNEVTAGNATGVTLTEQIYIRRGEMVIHAQEEKPEITSRLLVSLFWLSKSPMINGKDYILKLGTDKVSVRLENIERMINASDLTSSKKVENIQRHDVAECVLKLNQAIAFDIVEKISATSRFVIVDNYQICGGGIIREALEDDQAAVRDDVLVRNYKWIRSAIAQDQRSEQYQHNPR